MRPLFILLVASTCMYGSSGCSTFRPNGQPATASSCTTQARIVDYSDLDGCRLLLQLDDGRLLLPQKWPKEFVPQAAMRVRIGFEIVPEAVSICMVEDAVVRLSCIEPLEGISERPQPLPCAYTNSPFEVPWMNQALDRYNPERIVRYTWRDG